MMWEQVYKNGKQNAVPLCEDMPVKCVLQPQILSMHVSFLLIIEKLELRVILLDIVHIINYYVYNYNNNGPHKQVNF